MADTSVADTTHFLDAEGKIPNGIHSRGLIQHLAAIISAVTREAGGSQRELDVKSRRKPGRKPCPGLIHTGFEPGTTNILWRYPVCKDRGVIRNWQRTPWDKGGRPELLNIHRVTYRCGMLADPEDLSELESPDLEEPALSREIVATIHDDQLLGAAGDYGDPLAGFDLTTIGRFSGDH